MALCNWCGVEMTMGASCFVAELHHLGCDVQRCPVCGGQMRSCGCRFDEDGPDVDRMELDTNGDPMEIVEIDGKEVIVHFADLPDHDVTVVDGIPCTTALRTVIDVVVDMEDSELVAIVRDAVARELFTVAEAHARLAEDDMRTHPGAVLLRSIINAISWTS